MNKDMKKVIELGDKEIKYWNDCRNNTNNQKSWERYTTIIEGIRHYQNKIKSYYKIDFKNI